LRNKAQAKPSTPPTPPVIEDFNETQQQLMPAN